MTKKVRYKFGTLLRRKRAEADLHTLEQQLAERTAELNYYRSWIDSSSDAIYSKTLDGTIVTWNSSAERLYGYRADEITGKNVSLLLAPGIPNKMALLTERIVSGETVEHYETVRVRKDGALIDVSLTMSPIRDRAGNVAEISMIARDISERKRAEKKLIEREHFLQTLTDHLPGMIGYWTNELRCGFANNAYLEWFGKSAAQMRGIDIRELMGGELYRKNEPYIRGALAGEAQHFERTLIKADGSTGYTWAHYIPNIIEGAVHGFFVLVSDVTELKHAEAALRASQQQMHTLVDSVRSAIFTKDTAGHYLLVNSFHEEMTGIPSQEIIGRTDFDVMSGEVAERIALQDRSVMASLRPATFEEMIPARDGEIHHYLTTKVPLINENGEVYGLCGIATDITERRRMEDELRESRQQLANIINFLPDATFVIDNDMKVIAWNRAMEEMSGVSREEMLGQGDHAYTVPFYGERRKQLLDLLDIPDAELEARYQHVQRKGETLNAEVFTPALYGGKGAYIWVSGAPLYSADNKRIGAIEILRDISERKKVEEELQQAKVAAEAASRAKSEFLANMSHEIRTPMNAITGMAYLALQGNLAPRQKEYVENIRNAANSLLDIINDILDFSKIEAGRMELESVCFDLNEVFGSVSNLIAAKAAGKNLEVLFSRAPGTPEMLIGDPLRLRQILSNLVSNAIKFTEQGTVMVAVSAEKTSPQPDSALLTFSVADSGIGMDREHLARIFTPFTQADSSITRRFGGTGLGLSIVTKLLQLMGSTLEVVSEPGQGSTFFFTTRFGVVADQEQQRMETPEDLRGMKILVVDDSQDAMVMMESMLAALSFRPVLVNSGTAALQELDRASAAGDPYRLMLLDWRMPGMDGLETARKIRDELSLSRPPEIIMISGYLATDIHKEAQQLGIRVFLDKPFQTPPLFNAVMQALGRECRHQVRETEADVSSRQSVKQLHGIRVLLVEDNKINQVVAQEMLKRFGAEVITADNGRMAVDAIVGGGAFDMVFMDIQMPEMDGFEATAVIRRYRGDRELPIIAMTAHAFSEERDNCLEKGMNDHVAKPIDPDQLYSVMLRWIGSGKTVNMAGQPMRIDTAETSEIVPDILPGINVATVLKRCRDNRQLVRELMAAFREQNRDTGRNIRCVIEQGDHEQARFMAHSFKGVSATIGASALSTTMFELENCLANGDTGGCATLLDTVDNQLEEVMTSAEVLERIIGGDKAAGGAAPLLPGELEPLMREFHDSLRDNDLSAPRLFERLEEYLPAPEREEIRKQMIRLDFDRAAVVLERAAKLLGVGVQGLTDVRE